MANYRGPIRPGFDQSIFLPDKFTCSRKRMF